MEKLVNEIVSAEDCLDYSEEFMALEGATFKKDFGPWKAGEKVDVLTFKWDEKKVVEQDEDGEDKEGGKSCSLTLTPVA